MSSQTSSSMLVQTLKSQSFKDEAWRLSVWPCWNPSRYGQELHSILPLLVNQNTSPPLNNNNNNNILPYKPLLPRPCLSPRTLTLSPNPFHRTLQPRPLNKKQEEARVNSSVKYSGEKEPTILPLHLLITLILNHPHLLFPNQHRVRSNVRLCWLLLRLL